MIDTQALLSRAIERAQQLPLVGGAIRDYINHERTVAYLEGKAAARHLLQKTQRAATAIERKRCQRIVDDELRLLQSEAPHRTGRVALRTVRGRLFG